MGDVTDPGEFSGGQTCFLFSTVGHYCATFLYLSLDIFLFFYDIQVHSKAPGLHVKIKQQVYPFFSLLLLFEEIELYREAGNKTGVVFTRVQMLNAINFYFK